MDRRTIRRTVVSIGLTIVFLIAACLSVAYFAFGWNLTDISVPNYVITNRVGDHFEFSLDTERLLWEQHLPSPPENKLKDFPEIAAIRSLGLYVEQDSAGYHFETTSTSDDPEIGKTLRRAGIVLKNTQWTWTENDIIGKNATQPNDGITELRLPDYVRIGVGADGSYTATLDYDAMLSDCRFDLPLDPSTHSGYTAIMSLGVGLSLSDGVYRLQAQSTLETIMTQLAENHVRITSTAWTWTPAEMAQRAGSTASAPQPKQQDNSAQNPPQQPESHETPAPTDAPRQVDRSQGITSLYGFDQTALRTAIRNAKEAHYGSKFESGTVYANYFAVGDASTEHANCFRVIYEITSTDGTEFLIADVYDISSETGYSASDVVLHTAKTRAEVRSQSDLTPYTIYTLNGGSMVFPENSGKSPFDGDGYVMEKSIRQALTYDELWDIPQTNDLTLLQLLAFARNEMFARAGQPFDPSGSYYRHFASCDWYAPGENKISVSDLADKWPITTSNITTIKFLEKLIKEG